MSRPNNRIGAIARKVSKSVWARKGARYLAEYLAAWHWLKDNNSSLKFNKLKIPCRPNTWAAQAVQKSVGATAHTHSLYGSGACANN